MADSLVDILKRAGLGVERQTKTFHSCKRHQYDLALIAHQPATALELAIGVRLTLSKLRVFVCQSAQADEKIKLLVLPRYR